MQFFLYWRDLSHFKNVDEHVKKDKKSDIYINIYTIMKNISQVLIQIVFLF